MYTQFKRAGLDMAGNAVPFHQKFNNPRAAIHLMAGEAGVQLSGNTVGCICRVRNFRIVEEVMPFHIFIGAMTGTALGLIHIVKQTVIDAD
jgi:hypothetical protein